MPDAVRERELGAFPLASCCDGDEAGRPGARDVELAHASARRLRRDHDHVVAVGRRDPPKWMLRPCANSARGARLQVRRDLRAPHLLLTWSGTSIVTTCAP